MNKRFLFFLIVLMLFSCKSEIDSYETSIFSKYLGSINKEISVEKHLYIIVPNLVCKGCVVQIKPDLETSIKQLKKDNITILSSKKNYFSEEIVSATDFYYDEESKIDYIDLELYNITLVETEYESIKKISHLEIDNAESFIDYLKRYE